MFVNHTTFQYFDEFVQNYSKYIFAYYPHISNVLINFLSTEHYLKLEDVPFIEKLEDDLFAFSCYRNNDKVIGYIIFSPEKCSSFNFSHKECEAAIAHEVGHIIHYFNESLIGLPQIYQEIKADEVASKLGLTNPLISILNKLIDCDYYSDSKRSDMRKRIMLLNLKN